MRQITKINFVTNTSLQNISGGWSGLNYKLFQLLSKQYKINYIGPIIVGVNKVEDIKSKFKIAFGFKSNYPFYSEFRLNKISGILKKRIKDNSPCVFYGATPYMNFSPNNPYYVITDICFRGYYEHYNKDNYSESDIKRISTKEKYFLKNAKCVFFTSNWAIDETMAYYDLDGKNFVNIGIGGNIVGHQTLIDTPHVNLLYISQNFSKKGGQLVFKAFKRLYNFDNESKLRIIGGPPSEDVINHPGVDYLGFLDKSDLNQKKQYENVLGSSDLLVLPTKSDAAPLTIIECGYFGTPTVAPDRFAIPEMVINKTSGFLINSDFTEDDIFISIQDYFNLSIKERNTLRKKTFMHFNSHHNWEIIGKRLIDGMERTTN